MFYDEIMLREYARDFSMARVDERISTQAGKKMGAVTMGAPTHTAFADRWGWHGTVERCPKADCGILHTLGMARSTWEWPGKMKDFFAAWWNLATEVGRTFLDLLTNVVNPSPGADKNWAFPRTQAFINKVTGGGAGARASWGASSTPVRSPSSILQESKVARFILKEAEEDYEFLTALAADLDGIVTFAKNVKRGLDIIDTVSEWSDVIETEGSISEIKEIAEMLTDEDLGGTMDEFLSELIDEVLMPYIRELLEELPDALISLGAPDDLLPKIEEMVRSASRKI